VTSSVSERLWVVCKEANRPFPQLSEDPVVDFCIMEAIAMKVAKQTDEKREADERKQRLKSHRNLRGKKVGDPVPGSPAAAGPHGRR
jgi:hypothetical protein